MYFINSNRLKRDIIERKFNEHDRFVYIIVYLLLTTFFMEVFTYLPQKDTHTIFDYANSFVSVSSIFVGTYFIYKANGAEMGRDFAGRLFSLTWVRSIQFLLILISFLIIFDIMDTSFLHLSSFNYEVVNFIMFSSYLFAIYLHSYRDVLEIRSQEL
jgi:hypothetical protein